MASSAAEIYEQIMDASREETSGLDDENEKLAEAMAEYAKSIAPVGTQLTGDQHPGTFRDSFYVKENGTTNEGLPRRQVGSSDPTASFKEFGTAKTPKHATMARTAEYFNTANPRIEGE